jgi:hypothetical protein
MGTVNVEISTALALGKRRGEVGNDGTDFSALK